MFDPIPISSRACLKKCCTVTFILLRLISCTQVDLSPGLGDLLEAEGGGHDQGIRGEVLPFKHCQRLPCRCKQGLDKIIKIWKHNFGFKAFENMWHAHCSASRVSELDLGSSYWHFLWSFCGEWHFCFSNRESFHFLGYRPVIIWAVKPFVLQKSRQCSS